MKGYQFKMITSLAPKSSADSHDLTVRFKQKRNPDLSILLCLRARLYTVAVNLKVLWKISKSSFACDVKIA